MAYLALYRRFRPQGFDKLVGQDAIVKTLKNQIATDRVGHAYLFCGARGTGKTSAAKIFARAINCLSPVDGSPCGKCAACQALSGSNIDVVEMDAASNNKVEEVRELRENVQYPPVSCRYKVYIVDEVHMLTDSAFNALLKTLEEPPKHAVFILATTEPQKLPATILSRCMRFDFKLVETPVIAKLVADVYRELGKEFENEAVTAIAKAGNGSIRDALSVADVCLSYGSGKLTYRDVTEVLGAADGDKTHSLCRAILEGKEGAALEGVDALVKGGKNVSLLAKDTVNLFRDLLVVKNCKNPATVLDYPKEEIEKLVALSAVAPSERLLRIVEIFAELDGKMRYSAYPRTVLETAVIKAALPETDFDLAALLHRVNLLSEELSALKASGLQPAAPPVTEKGKADMAEIEEKPAKREASAPETAPRAEKTEKGVAPIAASEIAPKREEFDPALEGLAPPPEAEGLPDGAIPVYEPPRGVAAPRPQPPARPAVPVGEVPSGRLFGTFVRALRSGGQNMLWVACSELKHQETEDALRLFADDTTYRVLSKEDNLAALKEVLSRLSKKTLYLQKADEKPDSFQEDLQKLKRTFGDDVVTVK